MLCYKAAIFHIPPLVLKVVEKQIHSGKVNKRFRQDQDPGFKWCKNSCMWFSSAYLRLENANNLDSSYMLYSGISTQDIILIISECYMC